MSVVRLSILGLFLGWAMLPYAFFPKWKVVEGERIVAGAFHYCDATDIVACPVCTPSPLSCAVKINLNGTVSCVCNARGSSEGCTGAPGTHPKCSFWCFYPTQSCTATTCGTVNALDCPVNVLTGGCGNCRCVPLPTSPCPDDC